MKIDFIVGKLMFEDKVRIISNNKKIDIKFIRNEDHEYKSKPFFARSIELDELIKVRDSLTRFIEYKKNELNPVKCKIADKEEVIKLTNECLDKHSDIIEKLSKS